MAGQQQGISLAEFSQGGGPDDIDVEILDAAFAEYDYGGKVDHAVLALGVQYQDDSGRTYDQYYSAGELTFFVPSEDGSMAIPVADKSKLTDTCNAVKFLQSLIECGGEQMLGILAQGNVKALVGMKVHVKQHAQPKRTGLIRGGDDSKEKTVLLVSAIISWPGETTKAPAAKKGIAGAGKPVQARPPAQATTGPATSKPGLGGAGKKAAPAGKVNGAAGPATTTDSEDDKAIATECVMEILTENGGALAKKAIPALAFKKAQQKVDAGTLDAKHKQPVVQLMFQDAFLHELTESGAVTYDGATLSFPG